MVRSVYVAAAANRSRARERRRRPLATIVGGETAAAFEARTTAAVGRALLSDPLVLEAGALVAAGRADAVRCARLEAALFGLEALNAHDAGLVRELRRALDGEKTEAPISWPRADEALAAAR